jgi:hypothetical protein
MYTFLRKKEGDDGQVDDRRTSPRVPFAQRASVAVLSFPGGPKVPVWTINVSGPGLGLVASTPLDVGTRVEVTWPHFAIFGEVRHCRKISSTAFEVGIKTETVVNTPSLKENEHLSDSNLSLLTIAALHPDDAEVANLHLEACGECRRRLTSALDDVLKKDDAVPHNAKEAGEGL